MKITAPLNKVSERVNLGQCRDKAIWTNIRKLGPSEMGQTLDTGHLVGNFSNSSPSLIESSMTLTRKVKQRLDPRYFHITLMKITRQLVLIPQSRTSVSLLPIDPNRPPLTQPRHYLLRHRRRWLTPISPSKR